MNSPNSGESNTANDKNFCGTKRRRKKKMRRRRTIVAVAVLLMMELMKSGQIAVFQMFVLVLQILLSFAVGILLPDSSSEVNLRSNFFPEGGGRFGREDI